MPLPGGDTLGLGFWKFQFVLVPLQRQKTGFISGADID